MLKWYAVELHTHTYHSDGDFTLDNLVKVMKESGFSGVCLTDHNTFSGHSEFEKALKEYNFVGVKGIEWTTYFGHMLVLGEEKLTDWRLADKKYLDCSIKSIHNNNGIVGIAHPFALSTPVNTGYDFQFNIEDYSLVDFIEVWSRDFPEGRIRSIRAFELWEKKLNQGLRISATSGRDFHRVDIKDVSYGNTFVGIKENEDLTSENIIKAIKNGNVVVTLGPLLTAKINYNNKIYNIGDSIEENQYILDININTNQNIDLWRRFNIIPKEIHIINNGIKLYSIDANDNTSVNISPKEGWLRVDLIGEYNGNTDCKIAFTNPIYILCKSKNEG